MSSYPAPTQNIDFFNPAFFTQDETALTLGEANKIYAKKSGAIFSGAISAPSLTLNGVNVETKLLEIDANSNKLTDISYNNNVTYILNDLSINGILKLPNLPNVGNDISSNKQKTTKISYDANTSVTTIADTLKAGSTLIVGSQNYNASDEFYKLTGISRGATPLLTITDAVDLNGILNLPNHGNIDTVLSNFDEILVNMTYTSGPSNLLTINSNVKIPQNLELGTITDVEQKILDISNTTTNLETNVTGISYNTIQDLTTIDNSLNVTGNLQLNTITDVEQKILDISNTTTNLETILTDVSYVNSTTIVGGKLNIEESTGTTASATGGSLTLSHDNSGGASSIVFKNTNDATDYGYISYKDDYLNNTTAHRGLLEIGTQNDPPFSGQIDNICLFPSGYVGINTRTPQTMLDVNGDIKCNGNFELGTITDVEQKIIDISNNAAGTPYISYDAVNDKLDVEKDMDLSLNDLNCRFMRPYLGGAKYFLSQNFNSSYLEFRNGGHHIDSFYSNGTGRPLYINFYSESNIVLGSSLNNSTTTVNGNLHIIETSGTTPDSQAGSLILEHSDIGGTSSITFKSRKDPGTDFGYILYKDDISGNSGNDRSLLEIGVQNDSLSSNIDNIAIMPSGFLGINRTDPEYMLDLSGDMRTYGVRIEKRNYYPNNGDGISVRPTINPSDTASSGSIFDVRSAGYAARLFVGNYLTSPVWNEFYFGPLSGMPFGEESNTANYKAKLGTDGSVDCTEIKVNSIPLNSFTSFKLGTNYNNSIDWGRGRKMSFNNLTSDSTHSQLFTEYYDPPPFVIPTFEFTCNFLGTYEIYADVIYRNESGARHNPCIGIDIDNDISTTTGGLIAPNWNYTPFSETPFSVQYVRMSEGRVCSLHAKRTHTFSSTSQKVSILQFMETGGGTDFTDLASGFIILVATLKFKYIGNF